MKQFIKNIIFYFVIISTIFVGLFYCVDKGLKQSAYLNLAEWNEIYNGNINAHVIISGSSRAYKQVSPKILDSITNLNTYNLGLEGYHIPMQITKFEIYKKHNNHPKYIIQIVDHFSLTQRENLFDYEQFLPYLDDTTLTNQLKKYEGLNWSDYYLSYTKYIGKSNYIIAGLLEFFNLKSFKSPGYKGYYPKIDGNWQTSFDQELKKNPEGKHIELNQEVVSSFENFINECSNESAQTLIIYAPEFHTFQSYIQNRTEIVEVYQNIAAKHQNVSFIDFNDNEICKEKKYFYNPTHLNKKGAELFSKELADIFNKVIENEN